jgi:hypothetical protein
MKLLAMIALGILLSVATTAHAQTQTTGQISGTAADASGAVIPSAQITVVNSNTGQTRTTESNAEGYYNVPLLDAGNYTVTITAKGFQTVRREGITVAVSRSVLVDFRLQVGAVQEKVTIYAQEPLIEPSNPNTTTTFDATQLGSIPDPGNDLTYLANLAPGAIMNTYSPGQFPNGNVEFNGLPSTSNNFTIDGVEANNPYFSTNLTGASGLQLGLNAIQEVSINTESYAVDQGRLGGSQLNYITKSGSDNFHGNAWYLWNGDAMNARNFFSNLQGITKKPRSNVNEFGASFGGPILKDKLFFFADLEGTRIILPETLTSTLPTPTYDAYVLQQLPLGGVDSGGATLPPQPAEVPLYQSMFKLLGDTSLGLPTAVSGCPFDATTPGAEDGCANTRRFSLAPPTSETLFTLKLDYVRSTKDSFWIRFQINNGSTVSPDPVNSIFDLRTPAPIRSAAAGWTHIFSPNLTNQFNPGISYQSAVQNLVSPSQAHAALPISLSNGAFSVIGGNQSFVPSGFANTVWQLTDNIVWTRGRHTLKFGASLRRPLTTNLSNSSLVIPFVDQFSLAEFTYGAAGETFQSFPQSASLRIASANLGVYAMDTVRATQKLTLTFGLRADWNSDPVNKQRAFSLLNGSFDTISHDVNQPLNQVILANQAKLYANTPLLQWQPRLALAYALSPTTVFRGGFGLFGDALATTPSDTVGSLPPANFSPRGGLMGPVGGVGIFPGVPGSAVDTLLAANKQFQSGFANGALSCASPIAPPGDCLPVLSYFSYQSPSGRGIQSPYSMQWSVGLEHQFAANFRLAANYVGTSYQNGFYTNNSLNVSQSFCAGCFAPIAFNSSVDARFSSVGATQTGASSSYNALQVVAQKRMSHGLSLQLNYTYGHCLDYESNGGLLAFNIGALNGLPPEGLKRFYGNCDYDIRNSLNGSYLYELPFHSKHSWINSLVGGWGVSGTAFVRGGLPFSVQSPGGTFLFNNGFPVLYANAVPGQNAYEKNNIPNVTSPGTIQWLNPNAFQSVIDPSTFSCVPANNPQACQDGNLARNSFRGPNFRWGDFSITKRFKISERFTFRFDTQFFNVFNHPNFGLPGGATGFGSPGYPAAGVPTEPSTLFGFGTISNTVSPSTSLLGGKLGGDSSVRMIALQGRLEF